MKENKIMKLLPVDTALRIRRLLRLNILFAFIVFIIAGYLMLTGEYNSLQERKAAEFVYNLMAIGSLLYMALVWITCMLSKPFWFPVNSENK
jgi:hypothetical protein